MPPTNSAAILTHPEAVTYTTHKMTGQTFYIPVYDFVHNPTSLAVEEPPAQTIRKATVLCTTTERQAQGSLHQQLILTNSNS